MKFDKFENDKDAISETTSEQLYTSDCQIKNVAILSHFKNEENGDEIPMDTGQNGSQWLGENGENGGLNSSMFSMVFRT